MKLLELVLVDVYTGFDICFYFLLAQRRGLAVFVVLGFLLGSWIGMGLGMGVCYLSRFAFIMVEDFYEFLMQFFCFGNLTVELIRTYNRLH